MFVCPCVSVSPVSLCRADGGLSRTAASVDTVRTDAERTGARNDSNVRTTRFSTDDRQLGQYHYPHLTGSAPQPFSFPMQTTSHGTSR